MLYLGTVLAFLGIIFFFFVKFQAKMGAGFSGRKEKSILQAKLSKLATQIGCAGKQTIQ